MERNKSIPKVSRVFPNKTDIIQPCFSLVKECCNVRNNHGDEKIQRDEAELKAEVTFNAKEEEEDEYKEEAEFA